MSGQRREQADVFAMTAVFQSSGSPEVKEERRKGALVKIWHISSEWETVLKFKNQWPVRARYVVHVAQVQSESFLRGTQIFLMKWAVIKPPSPPSRYEGKKWMLHTGLRRMLEKGLYFTWDIWVDLECGDKENLSINIDSMVRLQISFQIFSLLLYRLLVLCGPF